MRPTTEVVTIFDLVVEFFVRRATSPDTADSVKVNEHSSHLSRALCSRTPPS